MERQLRIRGVRRKQIDEDKFAYALLLLAKSMKQESAESLNDEQSSDESEAA